MTSSYDASSDAFCSSYAFWAAEYSPGSRVELLAEPPTEGRAKMLRLSLWRV